MKSLNTIVILITTALFLLACGAAPESNSSAAVQQSSGEPEISVMEPFAQITTENGAVYMMLMNKGGSDDTLLSIESDVARAVELHETTMDENQVMRMSPLENLAVPAGGSATLEPGGMHVMLMGVQQELESGDKFNLTLNFEKSGPKTVEVEVKTGVAMDHSGHEGHDDEGNDHEHSKIPNDGAAINIVSPAPGSEIAAGEMIMVKIGTEDFDLGSDDRHWHLYVDGELVEMVEGGKSETMLHDLEAGDHTIMTVLVTADHSELEDGAMVTITVK